MAMGLILVEVVCGYRVDLGSVAIGFSKPITIPCKGPWCILKTPGTCWIENHKTAAFAIVSLNITGMLHGSFNKTESLIKAESYRKIFCQR